MVRRSYRDAEMLIQGAHTLGSARGPRFEMRNKRINWLIKNRSRLRRHCAKGTLRSLIKEMQAIGLWSKTTQISDIMVGFTNLIYIVEERINERIMADPKEGHVEDASSKRLSDLRQSIDGRVIYHLRPGRINNGSD